MMHKIKWLLVGAGDIAHKRVAPALSASSGSELVGVCDLHLSSAGELARQYGAEYIYDDLDLALENDRFDAVYLATPVHLHVDQALLALDAGKHVLIEKPLCIDVTEGRRLEERVAQAGRTVGCAYFRRLFPAYSLAKNMLYCQEFGRILLGRMTYHSWFQPEPDNPKYWRVVRELSGGGPLSDMGSHMLDVLVGLLGMPASVYARYSNLMTDWDVEDTASLVLNMPDGAQVTASFSWCSRTWQHEFELVGSEARVLFSPYDSGTVIRTVGRQAETLHLPPAANVHQPLIEDFIRAVQEQRDPVCPVSEALKTNLLLDAIYTSSQQNRVVEIPL